MIFKSVHFPNEVVATRRGSPLLIGVKTPKKLKVDFVDVEFAERKDLFVFILHQSKKEFKRRFCDELKFLTIFFLILPFP